MVSLAHYSGLSWVKGELKGSASGISVSADDSNLGAWIDGGVFWRFGESFNLGLEARYTKAKIEPELDGTTFDIEAGGFHLGLLIGIGWGR